MSATDPYFVGNDRLQHAQTAFVFEGDEFADGQQSNVTLNETNYSGGQSKVGQFREPGDFAEYEFTVDHTIPREELEFAIRFSGDEDSDDLPPHTWYFIEDGARTNLGGQDSITSWPNLEWRDVGVLTDGFQPYGLPDLEPGNTYRIGVEIDSGSLTEAILLDVIVPMDLRFVPDISNFDNTVDGNDALSDPQQYPAQTVVSFADASLRRDATQADVTQTWNNTENNQYIEVGIGDTTSRSNNSQTASVTVSDANAAKTVTVDVSLSHYTADSTSTPTTGDSGQTVDTHELTANPDAVVADDIGVALTRGIVPPNTIDGSTIREAGLKSNGNLLTRHEIAEFTLLQDQRLASAESTLITGGE